MQITEITNKGLKRAYLLTIPASDISGRIKAELRKIATQVKMPGFRPGKVPANLVKKRYGEQVHTQILDNVILASVEQLIKDRELITALTPKAELDEDYEEGKDAKITVEMEVMPVVDAYSIDGLKLERLTVPVSDEEVNQAIDDIALRNRLFQDAGQSSEAAEGDQLIIDYVATLDGVEFDRGRARDVSCVIGSQHLFPGFDEELIGARAGDTRAFKIAVPADYEQAYLAGEDVEFDVTVKQVNVEVEAGIDDEFARRLGFDNLDELKKSVRNDLVRRSEELTRMQMKRHLLDWLAAGHDFEVPERLVDAEFEQIWDQVTREARHQKDPEAALAEIQAEKDDYRRIAERRVRLGLLLSEIGQANGVEISQQEMNGLVHQKIRRLDQKAREEFIKNIRREPMLAAQLRAPLYEEKVVELLFKQAEITVREVTQEELEAAIEAEEEAAAKHHSTEGSGDRETVDENNPAAKSAE